MINKILLPLILLLLFYGPAQANPESSQLLYSPTTPEYLAKSYWPLKKLDENDNKNIDQYLMITECDLYQQYYNNDIEWSKIREATRGYIKTNRNNFPTRFEFVQPIYLGRYNVASQTFLIEKNSEMIGVGQMQVSGNYLSDYKCMNTSAYDRQLFPANAILNMARPLNYTSVKTSPETAQEYLKFIEDNRLMQPQGRPAYVRYRFKVEQSLNTVSLDNGIAANYFGNLESMSVFGDKSMFIKLEEVKF